MAPFAERWRQAHKPHPEDGWVIPGTLVYIVSIRQIGDQEAEVRAGYKRNPLGNPDRGPQQESLFRVVRHGGSWKVKTEKTLFAAG